jgi:hypothetical protein
MADLRNFDDLMNEYLKKQNEKSPSKPIKQKLSIAQMDSFDNRLKVLMPQFKKAIAKKNLSSARNIISDLQAVLRSLNKTTKLVEVKNQFFELALEEQKYDFAIEGFLSNRSLVNNTTRLHLEATALLAIAYLRKKEIEKAKPFIKEVLQNRNVIKTESTREKFNKEIIARFDEECALYSLTTDKPPELDIDTLHEEVIKVANTLTNDQLYSLMGKALPKLTKDLLFEVDKFSKNQLTYKEQKFLPSSEEMIKDEQAGRTVFASFKRVVYKSLCDPTSEVYKIWYSNIVGVVIDKKFITAAIGAALAGTGIGITALIVTAAALVLRFGLDIYCDRYKPSGITELRRKSE